MEWTESALREYLLGSSSPEVAERIEAQALEDEELFAALRSAEDDLIDAWARGRLAPADQARFLERHGHQSDRLRFAGAWAQRPGGATHGSPVARKPWIPLAAAAVLVLAAGTLFTQLEAPSVPPAPPAGAPQPPPFAVALTLGTSRAAAAATAVTIPAGTATVQMNVQIDPGDRFDRYAMELRGAGDRTVWSAGDLTAAAADGHLTLSARIPAAVVPAGSYELAIRGAGTDLGFVPLTVRWSP